MRFQVVLLKSANCSIQLPRMFFYFSFLLQSTILKTSVFIFDYRCFWAHHSLAFRDLFGKKMNLDCNGVFIRRGTEQ